MDLSQLQVEETEDIKSNRGRAAQPNPFENHLAQSYESQKTLGVTVPADEEKRITRAIRAGAEKTGLGVSIQIDDLGNGQVKVKFKAKDRARRTRKNEE